MARIPPPLHMLDAPLSLAEREMADRLQIHRDEYLRLKREMLLDGSIPPWKAKIYHAEPQPFYWVPR